MIQWFEHLILTHFPFILTWYPFLQIKHIPRSQLSRQLVGEEVTVTVEILVVTVIIVIMLGDGIITDEVRVSCGISEVVIAVTEVVSVVIVITKK